MLSFMLSGYIPSKGLYTWKINAIYSNFFYWIQKIFEFLYFDYFRARKFIQTYVIL